MEVNFSKSVHCYLLKLFGHITVIHMHFPLTPWQTNAWFSIYNKNNFLLYVFLFPIVKQIILVVF